MHVSSESTKCGMNQEFFLFNNIYIYIYIFLRCLIILFDSLNKENMNLNPFYHTSK